MSYIQQVLSRREMQADRGHTPSDYQEHHDLLCALDVIADQLERIAVALEETAGKEGK